MASALSRWLSTTPTRCCGNSPGSDGAGGGQVAQPVAAETAEGSHDLAERRELVLTLDTVILLCRYQGKSDKGNATESDNQNLKLKSLIRIVIVIRLNFSTFTKDFRQILQLSMICLICGKYVLLGKKNYPQDL